MKIALVDDDRSMLASLTEMLSAQLGIPLQKHIIDTYRSSESFLAEWHPGKYDLVILDIYMNGQNGIEAAGKIREKDPEVRLAFCTSSNEFAAETYDLDAIDYLKKPVTAERISRLLRKADLEQIERSRCVTLPDGTPLACRGIVCAEYRSHRMIFHLRSGEQHSVYSTFTQAEKLLAPFDFFYSPTKGILLNFYEVERLTDDSFIMKNGMSLPIARRAVKDARSKYSSFQFAALSREVNI